MTKLKVEIAGLEKDFRAICTQKNLKFDDTFSDVKLLELAMDDGEFSALEQQDFVSKGAAFLGTLVQKFFGGEWVEDELAGVALAGLKGQSCVVFSPAALLMKKLELGPKLSMERILAGMPAIVHWAQESRDDFFGKDDTLVSAWAELDQHWKEKTALTPAIRTKSLQVLWKDQFDKELELSLQGVMEAERFLRSQFFVRSVNHQTLIGLGIFIGEVARQLFQGRWKWSEDEKELTSRLSLEFPELPYYPVGKVYKFLATQPEGDSLDEYIRIIPSARKEMARKLGG